MANPVLFAVAGDGTIRHRLAHELERRYGADFRVIAVESATQGLATLDALHADGAEVAVIIAAPRLPEMTGLDFLEQAGDRHPGAQRGLLVVPGPAGMTEPIRRALLFGRLDFEIEAPWVSPDEWLYPTIADALSAWTRQHRPRAEAVTIVGRTMSPRGHEVRDLLERSGVPYGFYAADSPKGRDLLTKHGLDAERLPVAIYSNGTVHVDPSNEELAGALGGATQPPAEPVDVAIVGSGPAGLAAAVYGASEGLRTVVVESGALGGQAATSSLILNYLGFPRGLSGRELTARAFYQALLVGAQFTFIRRADDLRSRDGLHVLTFDNGAKLASAAVVVATGRAPRRLDVPALEALTGRGVFYGATGAEAAALAGEQVCVIGGGNAAGQATMHLAQHAARVTLLVRGDSLAAGMSDYLVQRIEAADNAEVRLDTRVVDGIGERRLRGLVIETGATGPRETLPAAALFVAIGGQPHTSWLPPAVARDRRGYVLTGRDLVAEQGSTSWPLDRTPLPLETSVPGVFAAGDVRHGAVNRVAAAAGEGALAIRSVHEYLNEIADANQRTMAPVATAPRGAP